jgi:hypothetical protein
MESTTDNGLTVSYDEEEGIITFDWDEETHPQYGWLSDLTADHLMEAILNYCNDIIDNKQETQAGDNHSEIQDGGSGSGAS